MLNYIWGGIMVVSVVISFFMGTTGAVSDAIISGGKASIDLLITMLSMMCLWNGIMKIAEFGGITSILSRIFAPVLNKLFPNYKHDIETSSAICSNVTANLLGLGNAATPLGIEAMKRMQKANPQKDTANNSMIMFVVLNTASIQLVPTTIAILRDKAGAVSPMDIVTCVWISSLFALLVGITITRLLEKGG